MSPALPVAASPDQAGRRRCPRCDGAMNTLLLPSHRPQPVPVDHCPGCRLVWFDALESVQLDGLGWTRLLRTMEDGRGRELALAAFGRPACLHCHEPLNAVQNRTRFGRFGVLECPHRHGQLQSHTSLLAERGLVRPLGAAERRALRAEKHALHCFNCGGPAQAGDDVCSWCASPLVVVDMPRLAHSLRLRMQRDFGASPAEQGVRVAWPCRGCGAPLDATRQTACPHCSHLVVAHELPDLLPLLEAAEAELRSAAQGRRALPGSTAVAPPTAGGPPASPPAARDVRPAAPAARSTGNAPIRTRRDRRLSTGERWLGWLPLVLLAALGLAAILGAGSTRLNRPALELVMAQPVGHDPGGSWALVALHEELTPGATREHGLLRRALLAQHLRQLVGPPHDARATVGSLLEDARARGVDELGLALRWQRVYSAAWEPQPGSDQWPPALAGREAGWRLRAPGMWWDERAEHGLWRLSLKNRSALALPLHEVSLRSGPSWRCSPLQAGLQWVAAGEAGELLCRTQSWIRMAQDDWATLLARLERGEPPALEWDLPRALGRPVMAAAERWTSDAAARARAQERSLLDNGAPPPSARQRWENASGAQRTLLGLGTLALGATVYSLVARLLGTRAARVLWMLAALPLVWWGGRGHGAASVLLVGMLLAVAAVAGLACEFVYRFYQGWLARRHAR